MPQNLIEKIAQRYAVDKIKEREVHSGDYLSIEPAHVMTHDNTGAVIKKFKEIGAKKVANPRQPVFTLDHNIQDTSDENRKKYEWIAEFAKQMGIDAYPAGRGIGHQIMCEEGYAFPGTFVVASDSHSNMYGGLGALGTPVVRTDAAAIWATGRTWWQVPPVAYVELRGELSPGVTGKDVIITLCGVFNHDEVLNHAIEFGGEGVASLTIDQRLAIANMTTEWGALTGVFPIDSITIAWLEARTAFVAKRRLENVPSDADGAGGHPRLNLRKIAWLGTYPLHADAHADYAKHIVLDLSSVTPHISGPNHVKVMTSVTEAEKKKIKIQKAYLVSCVNSRVEDLAEAAAVIKGKKIANGVKLYVAAASSEVEQVSRSRGDWEALIEAGAIPLPPGCGPCIGLGTGLLEDGEVGISATNRNFKGRMGSPHAQAYLASPAVVAASAVAGYICGPKKFEEKEMITAIESSVAKTKSSEKVPVLDGFPGIIEGELLFCHQDNMNTDGIYPGKYTYQDDITPTQQAQVAMENYDPEFGKIAKSGDILAGGFNFGTGSSREQAATALKYKGIRCVIAGTFNQTYQRNAINNGFLVIESPTFIQMLKLKFGDKKLTVRTGMKVTIDIANSNVIAEGKSYAMGAVGIPAQELIVAGGLEAWVRGRMGVGE